MPQPVFAFLAFTSGSFEGAIIRDMRLANDLHRRGYKVHVYWMMEKNAELVDPEIPQRVLCNGMRWQMGRPSQAFDLLGRGLGMFHARYHREVGQRLPNYVDWIMKSFVRALCDGADKDTALVSRLEKFLIDDGVTHFLPTFAMICPFAQAVQKRGRHPFKYLATFQGEEIFANYAHQLGRGEEYHQMLREVVAGSAWPAVAVSRDYILRLRDEMGIDESRLRAIYPGIEWPADLKENVAPFLLLEKRFPGIKSDIPIVTYIGRQDSEKGIDLLLYAVRMLLNRGVKIQLVICGGSSFGQKYPYVLQRIAEHLRVPMHHRLRISGDLRDALYHYSRCIVYPSIHREPFGMVAAEAMSRGTPVLVPDLGGITEAIQWEGKTGGLTFKAWDSADLSRQLERLITDDSLHAELVSNARSVASNFTVQKMTDQILEHLEVAQPVGV